MATHAETKEAATYRFPTEIKWGDGYFGDGMFYFVAASLEEATAWMVAETGGTCLPHHLQQKQTPGVGGWFWPHAFDRCAQDKLDGKMRA